MPRLLVSFLLVVGLFVPFAAGGEESLSAGEERAINTVIQAQINAFKNHDADAAFALAAPGIQAKFQTAENFISMVATQYLPLYSPKRTEFLGLVADGAAVIQRVKVVGPDDNEYIAYYPMERQENGSWKIGGCYIEPVTEPDTSAPEIDA
ncbi:MAG: DUF4864 domain-containing protein [Alphaproteobacteria bacterium]